MNRMRNEFTPLADTVDQAGIRLSQAELDTSVIELINTNDWHTKHARTRTANGLNASRVTTVRDVLAVSKAGLRRIEKIGPTSINLVNAVLRDRFNQAVELEDTMSYDRLTNLYDDSADLPVALAWLPDHHPGEQQRVADQYRTIGGLVTAKTTEVAEVIANSPHKTEMMSDAVVHGRALGLQRQAAAIAIGFDTQAHY